MKEGNLEKIMMSFYNHDFDLLISTSIIESGIDIPNANTIIIKMQTYLAYRNYTK
ncbi:MAG: hypothetical protein Ct9H90mP13_07990 [Pseudomonadota bacterium]|nr:MAG: hypothetical protein Ct9H90mP13_07990 [Pseudomonadota bacterium]